MSQTIPDVSPKRVNLGSILSLLVSLVLHLTATLVLSWIIIGSGGSGFRGISLDGTQLDDAMNTDSPTFEIATSDSMQTTDDREQPLSELPESPIQAKISPAATLFTQATSPSLSTASFEESGIAAAMGGAGAESEVGGAGVPKPSRDGSGASFFGTRAYGNRFVFVIDSSTSMKGRRWEALRIELNRAIRSLSPDQEFFVISFDFAAHPMFNEPPPKGKFLNPTKTNIDRMNRWIGSIDHGGATLPASAVGIALRMEPDAIFLLSDGEIRDATLTELRIYNRFEEADGNVRVTIPIHTVLLYSDVGYLTLKTIADENDGVFTPVNGFRNGP